MNYWPSVGVIRPVPFSTVVAEGMREFTLSEVHSLKAWLGISLLPEHLSHIVPIDEDIRHEAIVDISPMRDDMYRSTAK